MPNSLRAKLSKLRYKGEITQEEYSELIKKLDGHDDVLLKAKEEVINQFKWERDVAISQLEEIGAGLGLNMKIWLEEHDSALLDKVLVRVKEHHYLLSDRINSTDYGMFTVGIEQVISEMKAR